MKTLSILEAQAARKAAAHDLLKQAERLVFEAQIHLSNGIDPAGYTLAKAGYQAIREARAFVEVADWGRA